MPYKSLGVLIIWLYSYSYCMTEVNVQKMAEDQDSLLIIQDYH